MASIKKGDYIKCHDAEDLACLMMELAKEGIETDFCYERNGEEGYWLKVEKVTTYE